MDLATFFETPGVGGAVAMTAIVVLVVSYFLTLKWIARGQEHGNYGDPSPQEKSDG
jgi:hypothetical protein